MRVTTSAPGKLMVLGEHAVVYGYPCIVTAVDLRYSVTVEKDLQPQVVIETPVMRKYGQRFSATIEEVLGLRALPKSTSFVLAAVRRFYAHHQFPGGLKISTFGPEISYGLGSSSAVTVAAVAALAELYQVGFTPYEIYTLATEAVLEVQGKGSGFDVAAAVYGGTLYFEQGRKVIEPIETLGLPVVIGFSGDKVSTTNLIEHVREHKDSNPELVTETFGQIGKLVQQAKGLLWANDWVRLGILLDLNQELLVTLGVSTPQLSKQIFAARDAGAFGAKLSGAGGGDCMFALVDHLNKQTVSRAIEKAGGYIVPFNTGADGVRIELDAADQP